MIRDAGLLPEGLPYARGDRHPAVDRLLIGVRDLVADGTQDAKERLASVLATDCGMGVVRHADAGYEIAIETADEKGIDWRL